jgi:hypothetical protein
MPFVLWKVSDVDVRNFHVVQPQLWAINMINAISVAIPLRSVDDCGVLLYISPELTCDKGVISSDKFHQISHFLHMLLITCSIMCSSSSISCEYAVHLPIPASLCDAPSLQLQLRRTVTKSKRSPDHTIATQQVASWPSGTRRIASYRAAQATAIQAQAPAIKPQAPVRATAATTNQPRQRSRAHGSNPMTRVTRRLQYATTRSQNNWRRAS